MAYLEWSRASVGRVRPEHIQSISSRAESLAVRLAQELEAGQLPFLRMGYVAELKKSLPELIRQTQAYNNMLVLGIGGSALGARAIQKAFAPSQDMPGHEGRNLWIADNVCPVTIAKWLQGLNPKDTCVVTISKSGGTIETISQYFLVQDWLKESLGEEWKKHMILVTDEKKGYLREQANELGLASALVPDNLGGRYSALSAVGLLPAGYLGCDWEALLDGAASVATPLANNPQSLASHPSFSLACWAKALEDYQYSQLLFFCYEPLFATYGAWFAQLWAESLGKEGLGTQPVPAVGVTDQHSVNQMFLDGPRNKACLFISAQQRADGPLFAKNLPAGWEFLAARPFGELLKAEALGTRMALSLHGTPLVELVLDDASERSGGKMMMLLEIATVLTGWLMGINPLDQPAVELGKRIANARLGKPGSEKEAAMLAEFLKTAEERQAF